MKSCSTPLTTREMQVTLSLPAKPPRKFNHQGNSNQIHNGYHQKHNKWQMFCWGCEEKGTLWTVIGTASWWSHYENSREVPYKIINLPYDLAVHFLVFIWRKQKHYFCQKRYLLSNVLCVNICKNQDMEGT